MNREIELRSRTVQVFPGPEPMLSLMGAGCAEQDEDWPSRRNISSESMRGLGAGSTRACGERDPVQEKPHDCRDRDGARRPREESRVMLLFGRVRVAARPRKTSYTNFSNTTRRTYANGRQHHQFNRGCRDWPLHFFLKVILSNQSLDIRFSGTIARNDPARIPYHNGM